MMLTTLPKRSFVFSAMSLMRLTSKMDLLSLNTDLASRNCSEFLKKGILTRDEAISLCLVLESQPIRVPSEQLCQELEHFSQLVASLYIKSFIT